MDANNITAMLSTGDLRAILDSINVDEREDMVLVNPDGRGENASLVLVRVGRSMIMHAEGMPLEITVHDHDGDDAACFAQAVEGVRDRVAEGNALAMQVREHPGAQEMIACGLPAILAARMNGLDVPAELLDI
jgi:hypothetical protein